MEMNLVDGFSRAGCIVSYSFLKMRNPTYHKRSLSRKGFAQHNDLYCSRWVQKIKITKEEI